MTQVGHVVRVVAIVAGSLITEADVDIVAVHANLGLAAGEAGVKRLARMAKRLSGGCPLGPVFAEVAVKTVVSRRHIRLSSVMAGLTG